MIVFFREVSAGTLPQRGQHGKGEPLMASCRWRALRMIAGVLLISLAGAGPAAAQSVDALEATYRAWMKSHHLVRGELAIVHDRRLVFAQGYGGTQPNQPVLLASLSKSI